jgi:DNA-binding CsgD family transcriptional regulator
VAEICRRLEGLPLTIELAAARVRLFSPAALRQRLGRLDLFADGPRDQPPRLRSLRGAIAWSYDLLAPTAQRVFRRLAVFVGPVPLEGAALVARAGDEPIAAVETELATLVDQSLLQPVPGPGDEPWFRMLEPIREFSLELLAESGEEGEARAAHVDFVGGIAARGEAVSRFEPAVSVERWLDFAEHVLPEFRAATSWLADRGDHARLLELWVGFRNLWWNRNYMSEGRAWVEPALAAARTVDRTTCFALLWTGLLAAAQGDAVAAASLVEAGLAQAHALGDPALLARALRHAGQAAGYRDDDAAAVAYHRQAAALEAAPATPEGGPSALCELGSALVRLGELDEAERVLEQALAVADRLGARLPYALDLLGLGTIARLRGRLSAARSRLAAAFAVADELHDRSLAAEGLVGCAGIAVAAGDPARAARWLGAADATRERTGRGRYRNHRQYQELVATSRQVLGDRRYKEERVAGTRLSLAEAVAETTTQPLAAHRVRAPYGLTRREREVLRLLVEGRTDKEIATDLFISGNTVTNAHVRNILAKLGVRNRAAAVALAVREELV